MRYSCGNKGLLLKMIVENIDVNAEKHFNCWRKQLKYYSPNVA